MSTSKQQFEPDPLPANVRGYPPSLGEGAEWIENLHHSLNCLGAEQVTWAQASVIPCTIGDRKTIVFPPQLSENAPGLFSYLSTLALNNGIRLQRDRRGEKETSTQDERRKKWASILTLGAGMLANLENLAVAGHLDAPGLSGDGSGERVIQETTRAARLLVARGNHRPPVRNADKAPTTRGVAEVLSLVSMARAARAEGRPTKVGVGGFSMFSGEPGGIDLTRYDYQVDIDGELSAFSYFEGTQFHALGYQRPEPDLEIVINLLLGGGSINDCSLWASFDEVREDLYDLYVALNPNGEPLFGVFTTAYSIGMSVPGRGLRA